MCIQLYTYLKKHNLTKRWFQSFMDEPLDYLADTYVTGIQIIKENMPEFQYWKLLLPERVLLEQ